MSHFTREERDGTLIVTIDRPPLNALSADVLEEGAALLQEAADTPPEAGLVISGAGKAFTAGVDIKAAASGDPEMGRRLLAGINLFAASLYRLPCAVVGAVNGHAIGAGGIMCLACDWVMIADTDLKIGLPEAKAGLPFPPVPQIIMDEQMDAVWRRRLALSSRLLSPAEAIPAGLADELCPPDTLVERAAAMARELQAQPAFNAVKRNMRRKALAEIDTVFKDAGTNSGRAD